MNPEDQNIVLNISNIYVNYDSVQVLKDVSIFVKKQEIVSLIGANGAGKTTTLRSISGIVPVVKGDITFWGTSTISIPPNKIVALGISQIPERRELFPDFTVLENLEMGAYLLKDKKQIKETMDWCFELFPIIRERIKQVSGTLSGGEQQMLAIARGLMSNPKLLLMDEPSLGLAPKYVNEIFEIVQSVNKRGVTILLVEQNAYQALSIAHRGYVLENGSISVEGESRFLITDDRVKKAYLGG
jgi:branched-chain amino acid transport system ATP-binding protein